MMRRSPEHVFQFMMAELGTEGSIDGNQRLVIRGKFVPKVPHCLTFALEYCSLNLFFVSTIVHRVSLEEVYYRVCFVPDVPQYKYRAFARSGFEAFFRPVPGAYSYFFVGVDNFKY